jgi:NitT/TauT family transport system substrate-binding protein
MRRRVQPTLVAAAVLAVVTLLAACSSSASGPGSTPSKGGLTTIHVALLPLTNGAPMYVGLKEGFWKQEGLNIKITQTLSGGPVILPGLVSGEFQFGSPAYTDLILAAAQGLPVESIGPGDTAGSSAATDYSQIMTLKSSHITSVKQLAGKTIAINSLNGLGTVEVGTTLENAGLSPDSVHYVAINFPDMNAALQDHRVDAIWQQEPFLTELKQSGTPVNDVAATDIQIAKDYPVTTWLATKTYIATHRSIVIAFQKALKKSLAYTEAHPALVRQIVPTYTSVPASVAQKMILPTWVTSQNTAAIQKTIDLMYQFKIITKKPTVSSLVTPFPLS